MRIAPAMRSFAIRTTAAAASSAASPSGLPICASTSSCSRSSDTGRSTASSFPAVQAAEHEVRVGDRDPLAAAAVTDRPGRGACALRPDLEHPGVVDVGDRAATGADGVHVDHRHVDRHRVLELELGRHRRPAVLDQRDVGRGAAHVVGDDVGEARLGRRVRCGDHARSRSRHHGVHRRLGHDARADGAAIALHHQQLGPEAARGELAASSARCTGAAPAGSRR